MPSALIQTQLTYTISYIIYKIIQQEGTINNYRDFLYNKIKKVSYKLDGKKFSF